MSGDDRFSSSRGDRPITNVRLQSLMHMGSEDSSSSESDPTSTHGFVREGTKPGLTFESDVLDTAPPETLPPMEGDGAAEFYTLHEDSALGAWLLTSRSRRVVCQSMEGAPSSMLGQEIEPWCEWLAQVAA